MIVDLIEPTTATDKLAEKLCDPVTFIETFLKFKGQPLKLYPFQQRIARETNFLKDRVVIQKARAVGGSILCGALITYYSYVNNEAVFILISKTMEQSGFIASYVRRFFNSSPILAEIIDHKKSNKNDLWLKNGSVIYNRTAGIEGENLRGIHCENFGAICFDESAYLSDRAISTLLHCAHGAGEIHCSTPRRPQSFFYEACHSPDYKHFKVPASQSPRISKDEIERMRRLIRPSEFKTDILAQFAHGENSVFDADSIEKAIHHDLPIFDADSFNWGDGFPFTTNENKTYFFSLDTAKAGGDQWILTIGDLDRKTNSMTIVAYHAWVGSKGADDHPNARVTDDPTNIIADILRYTERFSCRKFYVDTTSNDYVAHVLLNQHLIPVEKVVWSLQRKEKLIEHTATALRAQKLAIPNDTTMVNQLMDFAYDTKRMQDNSERRIYLAGDDDYVDSLAMLSQAITGEKICVGGFIDAW